MVNYYFFFGEVIFAVLYFTVCAFTRKEYRVTVKKFLLLGVEAVIGLLMAGCLLLPSIMMVLSNPRLDNWLLGWSGLFYGNEQRYGLILSSLFFPPDVPAYPNMFPDSNAKWSSVSLYLPMFSTVGVIAWFKMKKKDWLKKLLLISLFIALIPILNSAFSLFNSAYYARWFFMPLLLMAAATVQGAGAGRTEYTAQRHSLDVAGGARLLGHCDLPEERRRGRDCFWSADGIS